MNTSKGETKYSSDTNMKMNNLEQNTERDINQASEGADSSSQRSTGRASNTFTPEGALSSQKNQVPEYLRSIGLDPRQFWPKKYRFTREKTPGKHNPLNISQRNFYESNGYIILDDCVAQKLLVAIRLQNNKFGQVDQFLLDKLLLSNINLLLYVKCFCDERVMLMTSQLLRSFQTSERARALMDNQQQQRQHLFRDWMYLPFRPLDKVVCTITALEPLDNVILVVPGTHRVGQCSISSTQESSSSVIDASQQDNLGQENSRELFECVPEKLSSLVEKSKKGFKYINLKAGQTLFYHPGLIHGYSDDLVNFNKPQLASVGYFAAADCEYVDLRKSDSQIADNMPVPISLSHFVGSNPCDYTAWLDKPKLIQDSRSSL